MPDLAERVAVCEQRLRDFEENVDRRMTNLREDVALLFDLDREREDAAIERAETRRTERQAARRFFITTLVATIGLIVAATGVTAALVAQF